jgi:excisionase family DNA binding protein
MVHRRELPAVKHGRRVHLDRQDLDAWIEQGKV